MGDTPSMNEAVFVAKGEGEWQRLSILCDKADNGAARLKGDELIEFVKLYRKASTDLALARTQSGNWELIAFLNNLVGRAYGILYQRPRKSFATVIKESLAAGAQTMRRRAVFVLASLGVLLLAAGFTAGVMVLRPDLATHFVSPNDPNLEHWKSGLQDERTLEESFAATGFYSSNNPRVAIIAGAVSASTFGVGTTALMWMNGSLLGAYCVEMARVGKLGFFLASIFPHGATELTGAVVSGGAGFVMAWALISPGRRSRGDALREAGKDAFVLLVMAVLMMFLAAPVEGFFSFNPRIPSAVKVAFGAIVLSAWFLYWCGYAREKPAPVSSS